ncbi:hypothetical protein [Xanthomonas sp. SHU 166]|uniref:hypothetical protein n=1 Tax=Xanthomonas sp. SHU 166 TaxID=1591170 RepID=UPI0018E33E77|nr:hypothetical protein [Xanthomonas sp. SHU 166]
MSGDLSARIGYRGDEGKFEMSGYFKVSMQAAKAIAEVSDGPDLLAGYMTLSAYAYGPKRELTAAGAKSIRLTTGCSDFRSKKVLKRLLSFDVDHELPQGLIAATGRKKANADEYRIERWDGEFAYLPSLLIERHPDYGSHLGQLMQLDQPESAIKDAILVLLHVYTATDYARWFGCPPDTMPYKEWDQSGYAGQDFELGYQGDVGALQLWLVAEREGEPWRVPIRVVAGLFGNDSEASIGRFWKAWECLIQAGCLVTVLSVQSGDRAYPLWVYSKAYRESLAESHGIVSDLGREAQLAACASGLDPDNLVIRYAVDEMGGVGSGLFYCFGKSPKVRTIVAPRLHAPTPINLDGLREASAVTRNISREIRAARRADREAYAD